MKYNFVHLEYPLTHPGVDRAEQAVANFKRMGDNFSPTRTLAAMLLAAIVAAFVVVADQMMATWADGHLLAAWVALWAVAFAAVGLFAGVSKKLAIQTKQALDAWSARLMSELQSALSRTNDDLPSLQSSTQRRVERMLQSRQYYI